jgi:hypothetical protein
MQLTVPSWVIPGTYLENLRFLRDKPEIQGVELLFFLYDPEIRTLLDQEWAGIMEYRNRFTFTAHLPDPLLPEHEELIRRLAPVVRHFIVHPDSPDRAQAQGDLLRSWGEQYSLGGGPLFLAENTLPERLPSLLPYLGKETGICMDTGHLLLEQKSPAAFFTLHQSRIGEIHLHSLDPPKALINGKLVDHRPLTVKDLSFPNPWLSELLPHLRPFKGIVNLEVFSWEEVCASLTVLREAGVLESRK